MSHSQDGTIIVPNEELQLIIKANNLPDDLGAKIQEHFSGPFSQLAEWQAKADSIVITSEDQVEEIALANDGRKTLVKIRTSLEKTRVELKAPYLNMGRAIDAVCKSLTERIEPIEADLKAKSDYAVNLAAERRNRLIAERKLALQEVGHEAEIPGLADLPEETFQMILGGAKEKVRLQREQEAREAADREAAELEAKAEAERIANAEKVLNHRILRLVEVGAKRRNDPVPYLSLGELAMSVEAIGAMQDESFGLLVQEFQAEAERLKQIEADHLALVQRAQDRKLQLVQLGGVEGAGIDGVGYGLGTASASLECIEQYGEVEWLYVVDSFKDEKQRLDELEAAKQQAQQERLQVANDRLAKLREVGYATSFADVADLTDLEFTTLLQVKTNDFNAAKERQRITNLGLMRKPLLDVQGEIRSAEFLGNLSEEEFQSMLDNAVRLKTNADQQRAQEAAQAAIEAQRKADEAQRKADEENARKKAESATDKEKLEEMVKQIQAIVMPTCTSIQGDAIARAAIERLNKIVGHMHESMNNM